MFAINEKQKPAYKNNCYRTRDFNSKHAAHILKINICTFASRTDNTRLFRNENVLFANANFSQPMMDENINNVKIIRILCQFANLHIHNGCEENIKTIK